tara:strand:- start:17920 stop:18498 length:579 start_codon:yes stop_codon:yes gene_type:complete
MANNLKNYVDYVKPVVRAIRENHNQFYDLAYYEISPEDLFAQDSKDLVNFMDPFGGKFTPKDFTGDIPLAYASFGEETGARVVLELSPENRKKLSEEVVDVFSGEYHREASECLHEWKITRDDTVYVLLEHQYYQQESGFIPSDSWGMIPSDSWGIVTTDRVRPFSFLSDGFGLDYLVDHIDDHHLIHWASE